MPRRFCLCEVQDFFQVGNTHFAVFKDQMQDTQIHSRSRIQAFVTLLDKSGIEGKRIHYWAYPGEKPVFDFTNVKPEGYRVHAFEVTGSWLHLKGLQIGIMIWKSIFRV